MIELNIQMFGGRGGGSGGGGGGIGTAGHAGNEKSATGRVGPSSSRGSAGGNGQHNGNARLESRREVTRSSGRLNKSDLLKEGTSRETFTLYRVNDANDQNEVEYADRTGRQIRDSIADEKLKYDSSAKVWVSKKGFMYVIRRKK